MGEINIMKRKYKWFYRIIASILAVSIFCASVSAAEIVDAVQHEFVVATEFPLEFLVKSDQNTPASDEKNKTISIRTIDEFKKFQKISLKISDYKTDEVIYSNLLTSSELIEVPALKVDHKYSLYVMVYDDSDYKEYDGEFNIFSNSETETFDVSLQYECISDNTLTEYVKPDENGKIPELTDEQYNEIYSQLEIPSFISEDDAKKAKHIQRLDQFNESYNTVGFCNADGTNTVYVFSSPVRYKDENGKIKDAESNIKAADQNYKNQGYSYINNFGEVKSYFPESLSNSKGVKVKKKDLEFEFGFSVGDNKKGFFEEAVSTIAGFFTQKDNKATFKKNKKLQKIEYKKANNKKNTIEAEPTIDGAKQILVLEQAPEDNKVKFWVNSKHLTAQKNGNNASVDFKNGTEEVAFSVGNIEIKDSYTGENEENVTHFSLNNTLEILEQNEEQTLVEVTLDHEMLTSPLTEYPLNVTVYASTGSTQLDSSYFEDRTVYNNGARGNANDPYLIVGQNGTYYDSVTCTYKPREGVSLMKYDLSNLASINPADISKMELKVYEGSGNSLGVTVHAKRVTSNWNEATVGSSQLNYIDNYYTGNSCLYISSSGTKSFNITQMGKEHLINQKGLSGGIDNYGLALRTYAYAPRKDICSSEHGTLSYRPRLVIQYETPQTPTDLGLSTNKIYLLKNLSTSKYLSVANGHQVNGTSVKQESKTYDTSMYWKLEYLSDTNEYRFIPMNATSSRLDVKTSLNTNGAAVGIYNNGGYQSSKWKIVKNGTNNFSILSSLSYGTKGLKASGNNIVIYDSDSDDHWQFIEAKCDKTMSSYIDSHVLDLIQSESDTKYKCLICGKEFNSPEKDDLNILDDADLMTVYTLQQLYIYEMGNKEYLKAEACLRAIDKIRGQTEYKNSGTSKYQYRSKDGDYVSPIDYEYALPASGSSYNVAIDITTQKTTFGGFALKALLLAVLNQGKEIMFGPFSDIQDIYDNYVLLEDVEEIMGKKSEYALAEVAATVGYFYAEKKIGELKKVPGKVGKAASKVSKILTVLEIAYNTYHIARNETRLPGNYAIQIYIRSSSGADKFIGDYGFKSLTGSVATMGKRHQKNIINEHFDYWDKGDYNPVNPGYGKITIDYIEGVSSKPDDTFYFVQ